jgi:tRNA A-37 threonylcarbamoyl transferase component Bud32
MLKRRTRSPVIESFDLPPGRVLARKYEILSRLGTGWEGEVYKIRETATGIERAAKLFFPHRNPRNRAASIYAQRLHALRHCDILIHYVTQEIVRLRSRDITLLISEYVEGQLLSVFIDQQRGKRLSVFEALHLLYQLAKGTAVIHQAREYHGDLHTDNIIVRRYGVGFEVKLIDLFQRDSTRRENIQEDVIDLIRVFYDAVGGAQRYRKLPIEAKRICCGLKRGLILEKFRTAGQLRDYLETLEWGPRV